MVFGVENFPVIAVSSMFQSQPIYSVLAGKLCYSWQQELGGVNDGFMSLLSFYTKVWLLCFNICGHIILFVIGALKKAHTGDFSTSQQSSTQQHNRLSGNTEAIVFICADVNANRGMGGNALRKSKSQTFGRCN